MRRILFLIFFVFAGINGAWAQSYPDYTSTTVNDLAELLSTQELAALDAQLSGLRADTGVEMTVLTLPSQAPYAPDITLEAFATGLFNHWGIGDASRNDGVLILILRDDRAMRVELGAAYARDWDRAAEDVVDRVFLPAFRDGDYPAGILNGAVAVIDQIVLPFRAGSPAPEPAASGGDSPWAFAVMAGVMALFFGRGALANGLARFRVCPSCNTRGLRQSTRTVRSATTSSTGQGVRRTTCPRCGYVNETTYTIARRSRSSSGGFGGGRSGGGGASGRW
ncbi:MAG: TPM domain-containing protein [Pseudomonadota bacterium]